MEDLWIAIGAFIEERDWEQFHSPKNLAMALSVEVSEVSEHFQWPTQEESRNLPVDTLTEVREEIGDVRIYLTELADKLGVDPVEEAKAKFCINGEKYLQHWSEAGLTSTLSTRDAEDFCFYCRRPECQAAPSGLYSKSHPG